MKNFIKSWLPSILIAVVCSLLIRTYVAEAMLVPSGSMLPTIQLQDRVVVEKLMGITHLEHGDIVVFYPPVEGEEHTRFVKRLIGLPGDTIQIKEGYLYRNGEKVTETYLEQQMNYSFGPVTVPADHYFFLGDNRNNSFDSHLWPTPFVAKQQLIGKVLVNIPTHYLFGD
ncbi:signal peptidase I [Paenibacillus sp. HB172176]|uniref:signal peptidase I n=1 Tax=Paenibacillus sp. HB172176 TaxID=2493690 RepID=UPI00143C90C5|nr:signal peptidase I [Paenibacillus sp. HB172176]